ncbi:MAG: DUF2905 domain-containing protein [Proteobacteria bacterium]|nr:DUF2905 domain-containing protein [Pseudomonadota bacterium]
MGKHLMVLGACLFLLGAWMTWGWPLRGGLPGDISIERPGFSFQFPIVTCLVVSVVLSLILKWLNR